MEIRPGELGAGEIRAREVGLAEILTPEVGAGEAPRRAALAGRLFVVAHAGLS